MAITIKKVSNFASARGTPASATLWDKVEWDFDAKNIKVVVQAGSLGDLEVSLNGIDVHCKLFAPVVNQNHMVYDFSAIGVSRLFIRGNAANIELYAFGVN